jgi:hypothetical protein
VHANQRPKGFRTEAKNILDFLADQTPKQLIVAAGRMRRRTARRVDGWVCSGGLIQKADEGTAQA